MKYDLTAIRLGMLGEHWQHLTDEERAEIQRIARLAQRRAIAKIAQEHYAVLTREQILAALDAAMDEWWKEQLAEEERAEMLARIASLRT